MLYCVLRIIINSLYGLEVLTESSIVAVFAAATATDIDRATATVLSYYCDILLPLPPLPLELLIQCKIAYVLFMCIFLSFFSSPFDRMGKHLRIGPMDLKSAMSTWNAF
jgi:hypothetical protein